MLHGRVPLVLLIVPLFGAGGCSPVERWSSTKTDVTLAPPPFIDSSDHATMWSFKSGALHRFPSSATDPGCDRPNLDGSALRPGRVRSWLVGKNRIYHFDGCGDPEEVRLARPLQFASDAAAVVGDDQLLVAGIANPEGKLRPLWMLRLLDGKQMADDVYLQADGLIADDPGPDSVRLIRSRSGDETLWVVVRNLLCTLGDDLRQPQPDRRTCRGIGLPTTIHDVADTGVHRPLWIATDKGVFTWKPPRSPASLEPIPQLDRKMVSIAADPVDADVAWALDDDGGLYRLKLSSDPADRVQPVNLGTNNAYHHVRVVHGRVLLLGNSGADECLRCKSVALDGSPAVQMLAVGVYEEAYPGPGGAIWLSARNESALCTPTLERRLPLPALSLPVTVVGVMVLVVGGAVLVFVRRRLSRPAEPRDVVTSPRTRLLARLGELVAAEFDAIVFKLGIPTEFLRSDNQAHRAIDMLQYLESNGGLDDLEKLLAARQRRRGSAQD